MLVTHLMLANVILLVINAFIFAFYWLKKKSRHHRNFFALMISLMLVGAIHSRLPEYSPLIKQFAFISIVFSNYAYIYFLGQLSNVKIPFKHFSIVTLVSTVLMVLFDFTISFHLGDVLAGFIAAYPLVLTGFLLIRLENKDIFSIRVLSVIALVYGILLGSFPITSMLTAFFPPLILATICVISITIIGGHAISEIIEEEKNFIFSQMDKNKKIDAAIRLHDLSRINNSLIDQIVPPIEAINTEIDRLMLGIPLSQKSNQHLSLIRQCAIDISHNLSQLKGYKNEMFSPKDRWHGLKDLIAEAFDVFYKKYPDVDVDFPLIPNSNAQILDQTGLLPVAISNVLENAWEARTQITPHLAFEIVEYEQAVSFKIIDNGKGIAFTEKDLIFNPFYTDHPGSGHLGVGLSVSRAIINANNGELKIESLANPTIFTINLPTKKA